MSKSVFRSCLAAWYDLGNGELMLSSIQDTVVHKQANRRSDVIRKIIYKNKEQDRS